MNSEQRNSSQEVKTQQVTKKKKEAFKIKQEVNKRQK